MIPQKHSFAGDCIQALVDNITLPEFQGNIIIIVSLPNIAILCSSELSMFVSAGWLQRSDGASVC